MSWIDSVCSFASFKHTVEMRSRRNGIKVRLDTKLECDNFSAGMMMLVTANSLLSNVPFEIYILFWISLDTERRLRPVGSDDICG